MDNFIRNYQKIYPVKGIKIVFLLLFFVASYSIGTFFSTNMGVELTIRFAPGIALYVYLNSSYRKWLIVFITQFIVSWLLCLLFSIPFGFFIAFVESLLAVISAVIFRIVNRHPIYLTHGRSLINYSIAVGFSAIVCGLFTQYISTFFEFQLNNTFYWLTWTLSSCIGLMLITPALLWWQRVNRLVLIDSIRNSLTEIILLFSITITVTYFLFNNQITVFYFTIDFPYLIFPFVFWAAIRFHSRVLSLLLMCISVVVLFYVKRKVINEFDDFENFRTIVFSQFFLLFTIFFSYVMAFITYRRNEAEGKIKKLNARLESRVKSRTSQLAETMVALQQSEEQFREAFENSTQGMALISPEGNFKRVNRALCDMMGYKISDLLKLNIRKVTHRDDYISELRHLKKLIKGDEQFYQIEKRFIHKQKLEIWVFQSNSIVRDNDGKPILIVSQILDITERRQAEIQLRKTTDTLTVLLREVNHRVKNNLSALIGIMHMEEDRAEMQGKTEFVELLKNLSIRIRGLAMVHSMLSAQNWQPLEVSRLCEQIVYATIKGMTPDALTKMDIEVSKIMINANQAHHLTLVLNELATNSVKYGVHFSPEGKITVRIVQEENRTKIIFKDNGEGYPEEIINGKYEKCNIGFDIILGIVISSLDGEVVFRNDQGAVTEISFENELMQKIK